MLLAGQLLPLGEVGVSASTEMDYLAVRVRAAVPVRHRRRGKQRESTVREYKDNGLQSTVRYYNNSECREKAKRRTSAVAEYQVKVKQACRVALAFVSIARNVGRLTWMLTAGCK